MGPLVLMTLARNLRGNLIFFGGYIMEVRFTAQCIRFVSLSVTEIDMIQHSLLLSFDRGWSECSVACASQNFDANYHVDQMLAKNSNLCTLLFSGHGTHDYFHH